MTLGNNKLIQPISPIYINLILLIMAFSIYINANAKEYRPGSIDWVKQKLKLYPELSWLLQPNSKYTRDMQSWLKNSCPSRLFEIPILHNQFINFKISKSED